MSKLGDLIRSISATTRNQFEVAEWGDEGQPLIIYSTPLTAGEFNKLQNKHPNFLNDMKMDALVDLIILKAEDENGEKLFDLEDKPTLRRQPVVTISNVAAGVMGEIHSIEDAEKN